MTTTASTTRRSLLAAACGTCAAALTGCAVYGPGRPAAAVPVAPAPTEAPAAGVPIADALAAAATIPVGGGRVFADLDLVVTRPTEGEFRAFSATCTHQGCAVTEVTDGEIVCPCHGSTFSAVDGSPTAGPAEQPLPRRTVAVRDGSVVLA